MRLLIHLAIDRLKAIDSRFVLGRQMKCIVAIAHARCICGDAYPFGEHFTVSYHESRVVSDEEGVDAC